MGRKKQVQKNESEDVVIEKWVRGKIIGRGSFGTVNLAVALTKTNPHTPLLMAVKSSTFPHSSSLEKERQVMAELQECPHILRCFGHDITLKKEHLYNLFLELASGGSLADRGRLPENEVRGYTASVLKGLSYMHQRGLVHCDVKLQNMLLCSWEQEVKIADFGLVKKAEEKVEEGVCLRGTPVNMAPESVSRIEYEPPSDIWALGCAVVEMITGKPAWRGDANINSLLLRIGFSDELPDIPKELSEEGRDFLNRCFVRDPAKRWTAEMLLQHPFVVTDGLVGGDGVHSNHSPRSVLDFMPQDPLQSSLCLETVNGNEEQLHPVGVSSPADRIRRLATGKLPNWSDCEEDWVTLRKTEESSVSKLKKIQPLDCSVSSTTDSSILLGQTAQISGNRDGNSDSFVSESTEIQDLGYSVSSRSKSLLLLEQMLLDENSHLSQVTEFQIHSSSASSSGDSSMKEEIVHGNRERNSDSSVSQSSKIQALGCSVSSTSDTSLVLEQAMLIDKKRERNLGSCVSEFAGIEIEPVEVSGFNRVKRFRYSEEETA